MRKLEDFAGWIILLSGWPRYFVLLIAGAASALAMPPFDQVYILYFTFPLLVWAMDGLAADPESGFFQRLRDGFKPGFFFGFGYFFGGIWWIGNAFLVDAHGFLWALPLAIIGVPTMLACFWGIATLFARLFWGGDFRRLFFLAAFFAIAEYLRGMVLTGFPWNPIGSAAAFTPILMQSTSVIGIYGLTAIAVFLFSAPGIFTPGSEYQRGGKKLVLVFVVLFAAIHAGFGAYRISNAGSDYVDGVQLRLMQPNIDQRDKFDREKEAEVISTYLDVSTSASQTGKEGLSGITHLVWPESVFPFFLTQRRDVLASIEAMLPAGTSLITGAVRGEASSGPGPGYVFNSVYIINDRGEIISASDKTHLVPFGEYLPFQKLLESWGLRQLTELEGGFEPGITRRLISTGTGPSFLALICYEIIFSGAIWEPANHASERPEWIVNVTNDGWFGNTPGPYQHERQAQLRAVEEGLPVVRVANTGISGVYDAYGRPVNRIGLGERGAVDSPLPVALGGTIFVHYGDLPLWIIIGLFFAVGMLPQGIARPTFG